MAKSTGGRGSITKVGKFTPSSYYSGAKTESYRNPPMHTAKQPGGRTAKVVKCPSRGRSSY